MREKKLICQVAVGGCLRAQGRTGSGDVGRGEAQLWTPRGKEDARVFLIYCTSGMSWKSALESSVPMDRAMK